MNSPLERPLAPPSSFEAKTAQSAADRLDASSARQSAAYSGFLSRLQAATRRDDRRAVSRLIRYPLRVNTAGGVRSYPDARSVEQDFDLIFTPKVRRATCEMTVS